MAEPSGERSLVRLTRTSYLPISVLLTALATWAVVRSSPGVYVADNRFDQFERPWQRFTSSFHAWDGSRGLGAAREDVWPGSTLPVAVFRSLGAPTWLAERLFHASCLALFGIGVVAVLRLARRQIGLEHLLAALVAMFGSYAAAFLVPSNLWLNVALSPVLVVVLVRGTTDGRPWRWAAGCALVVCWAGNPDLPGLAAGALPMAVAAVWLVLVGSTTLRVVAAWVGRAALLTLVCSAWALTKAYTARDVLFGRLSGTESVGTAAETSSWSESIRGLGNWLSYFRVRGGLLKPQGEPFLANPFVVIATFAVPIAALAALAVCRWRAKGLFGLFLVGSLAMVVGGFALPRPTPFGRFITAVMESVPLFGSFRNTYKMAAGLVIGVAVLAAVGVSDATKRLRADRPGWWGTTVALSTGVLVLLTVPFWTGRVYSPTAEFRQLPAYWTDALSYLDRPGAEGRVAILPAVSRARYRWGSVGDDIFEALLERPHSVLTGVPRSTPVAQAALESLTQSAHEPMFRPGVVAAIARRLGISEIVIRNDLAWEVNDLPRPAAYDSLRNDPGLELVASFGAAGLNVSLPSATGPITSRERLLPPVEVYRVRDDQPGIRLAPAESPVIVSGDPLAWPTLFESELVRGDAPILHSGAMPDAELRRVLERGGAVAVTDTNRRRVRMIRSYEPWSSITLAADQEIDRPVSPVFTGAGAMSTAWYPDAVDITSFDGDLGQATVSPQNRPANAFDGNPATAWAVNPVIASERPGVKVTFRSPQPMSTLRLSALLDPLGRPTVQRVLVTLSNGATVIVPVGPAGGAAVRLPERTVDSLSVTLLDFDQDQSRVGLSEVVIGGLDLREFVQTPTDVVGRVGAADGLLARAPSAFAFTRMKRSTAFVIPLLAGRRYDDEVDLRRRFLVSRPDDYRADGTLSLLADVGDEQVADLLAQPVEVESSAVGQPFVRNPAAWAADGDPGSAWTSGTSGEEFLTVRFPARRVGTVTISGESIGGQPDAEVRVELGTVTQVLRLASLWDDCEDSAGSSRRGVRRCGFTAVVEVPGGIPAESLTVRFDGEDARLRLAEVTVDGGGSPASPTLVDTSQPVSTGCRPVGLVVEDASGVRHRLLGRLQGSGSAALAGETLSFEPCRADRLAAGWALLESDGSSSVDSVTMRTTDWPSSVTAAPGTVDGWTGRDGRRSAVVSSDGQGPVRVTVVLPESFDRRWVMSVDGGAAVPASAVDAMNGWTVDVDRGTSLSFRFRPERQVTVSMWLTIVSVVVCLGLWCAPIRRRRSDHATIASLGAERRRRSATPFDPPLLADRQPASLRGTAIALGAATVAGLALGGVWAIPVALIVVGAVALTRAADATPIVGVAAPGLLSLAAFVSVLTGSSTLGIAYVQSRAVASDIALLAVLVTLHVVALECASVRASVSAAAAERTDGRLVGRQRARG